MSMKKTGLSQGWPLVGIAAVVIGVCGAIILHSAADPVAGLRRAIRVTARTSLVLFVLAFTASALWQRWPGAWTRWQRQNRRYLGVSFATSHFMHLGVILTLGYKAPAELSALTTPVTWVFGGLAYLLIAAMTLTSFDRTAQMMGPRAWKILHTAGSYYIWLVFANSYVGRAVTMPEYIAPAGAGHQCWGVASCSLDYSRAITPGGTGELDRCPRGL